MKPQPALVRANRAVHLNPESAVNMKRPVIVPPGNAKHDYPLRLDNTLKNSFAAILGVLLEHNGKGVDYFLNRLVKLPFGRVLGLHLGHQLCCVVSHSESLGRSRALDVSLRPAKIESKIL